MMRLASEQRVVDMQLESDSCRARLHSLQEEFRKMEEMVANMLQYKVKIDQLKQENASMKTSYENNLQKYCSHISSLERDNMLLRNQVKKMEAQVHGKGDERDKTKLLLERLKMVEAENSSLVLENEQQRQQYEKCLDEIANQVVQALLAQKTLREECLKLQTRVQDLELQNKHLNTMFKHRLRITSDSVLQVQHTACITTNQLCRTTVTESASGDADIMPGDMTLEFLNNAESLQSMCSELIGDDSPGKPQLSSPPPWLKEKLNAAGGDTSPSSTASSASTASPGSLEGKDVTMQTKIETEFPVNNSSPKMKHIRVISSRTRSLEREYMRSSCWQQQRDRGEYRSRRGSETEKSGLSHTSLKQSTSADAISHYGIGNKVSSSFISSTSSHDRLAPQSLLQTLPTDSGPAVLLAGADFNHKSFEAFNKNFEKLLAKSTSEDKNTTPQIPALLSQGEQLTGNQSKSSKKQTPPKKNFIGKNSEKVKDDIHTKAKNSAPLRNPFSDIQRTPKSPSNATTGQYYYYDYSDEDSDSRPVSRDFSTASTMSLNELLDSSLEGEVAIDDDFFSDWSSVCFSPRNRIENMSGVAISNQAMQSRLTSTSGSRSTSSSPENPGMSVQNKKDGRCKVSPRIHPSAQNSEVSQGCDTMIDSSSTSSSSMTGPNSLSMHPTKSKLSDNVTRTQVSVEVHSESQAKFLPSPSPSPNPSQKSDLGYGSKSSHSQSSSSPSPALSQRGAPPWLHSTKDPHSFTRNELLSLVINKDPMGSPKNAAASSLSSSQSPKLVRPGQLILAPQDKNFTFQGFSSTSSTSSEDRSPLKMFESKHNSDMKSSVIEVKKDGTFVHPSQSLVDSSSDNSSSVPGSPLSPLKSPLKLPPPVAKKPMRAVKPEARAPPNDNIDKPLGSKNNITVGYVFHDGQPFPGHSVSHSMDNFIKMALKESKHTSTHTGMDSGGSSIQTKCQSSDSSFENLKVERSGSKDDGYSTMSSDIHPEVLEKFSDTLTRKFSEAEAEQFKNTLRYTGHEVDVSHVFDRQHSDLTVPSRDRSFDFTSDPDSALETSVHSTAEMVTSSSSQISTSSSDFPLSPCTSKVSKIAKLFDSENTKVNFIHGASSSLQCNYSVPQSTKGAGNLITTSPVSPNAIISSFQQPESPRRLANEFHKNSRTSNISMNSVKTTPGSPKSVNKNVSCAKLVTSGSQSGIPVLSMGKKSVEVKASKPDSPVPMCLSIKRLPKGFYSSNTTRNTVNPVEKQVSVQDSVQSTTGQSGSTGQETSESPPACKLERSNQAVSKPEKSVAMSIPAGNSGQSVQSINSVVSKVTKESTLQTKNQLLCASNRSNNVSSIKYKVPAGVSNVDPKVVSGSLSNIRDETVQVSASKTPGVSASKCESAESQRKRPCVVLTNQFYQQFSSDSDTTEEEKDSPRFIPSQNNVSESSSPHTSLKIINSCSGSRALATDPSSALTKFKAESCALAASTSMQNNRSSDHLSSFVYQQLSQCQTNHPLPQPSNQFPSKSSIKVKLTHSLRRSKSEQCLSTKQKCRSGQREGSQWDSGRILDRSTSMTELDRLNSVSIHQHSGPYGWLMWDSSIEPQDSDKHHFAWGLLQSPLSSFTASKTPKLYPQHQKHQPGVYYHYSPYHQALRLDLSDVTELDEDGSELATTRDSLDSNLALNESPGLGVEEQKRFNSQFYSLCKVDSNRSLLSSGNESRDKSSLTSLNEILSCKSIDGGGDVCHSDVDDEIALREFDEISRQIAGLSKTVDELNQSLSSLNSGEFEPTSHHSLMSSPRPTSSGASRVDVIDGYHWVEDEFFLTSSNGEIIIGGSNLAKEDSFNDIFAQNSSFDLNSTEDATEEFYRVPLHKKSGPQMDGQDEIFASSCFNTVREKHNFEAGAMDSNSSSGRNEGRGEMNGEVDVVKGNNEVCNQNEFFSGSNNDSDDSLASDIGLDHMMCQRLFGCKDHIQQSSDCNPSLDLGRLLKCFANSEKDAINAKDSTSTNECAFTDAKSILRKWNLAQKSEALQDQEPEISVLENNEVTAPAKETRDVGIDAMSHSQRSLSTSFDSFDQSVISVGTYDFSQSKGDNREKSDDVDHPSLRLKSQENVQGISSDSKSWNAGDATIISHGGCESGPSSLPLLNVKELSQNRAMAKENPASYSDFVADLKVSAASSLVLPPKLPPRSPIITNGSLHVGLDRDIPPLPPPPLCLNNEPCHHSLPSYIPHSQTVVRPHSPYVNQQNTALLGQRSRWNARPLSDSLIVKNRSPCSAPSTAPPLPPRHPQISQTLDGGPRMLVQPHRFQQVETEECGLPSFQHYLIDKQKASSTSSCTFPRPRSHSETSNSVNRSSGPMDRMKDDMTPSRIPRRKLKTRRELSKLKQSSERSSLESGARSPDTSLPILRHSRELSSPTAKGDSKD
ncbi:uncharacterized protein LOC106072418 isoform X2 [Biomphalaria glabrata]|nr:uncharacterized protein LOC106072418 isoform X2 [Biomphalaria glabrata]XP_055869444.1 uncharacterized protein LOC106072418 isoform X2 [Biomphalaria glabrata]XP_055869445.1 uncharacterized protein LOC106072418 isoform X2 [Biomphalaria glabrata]XP_055869446.1 uncharacterized protein LOC106072418 isoform X2 [Biomphalaria glabrata]XP_055869447.1 uncharacterized protein LOC106072418 isoform X2 [Biomphalaria glabrata]XP_055869448.1 uncharacterized protein LOC106072418 isoform X2 [Biomphalaria gla